MKFHKKTRKNILSNRFTSFSTQTKVYSDRTNDYIFAFNFIRTTLITKTFNDSNTKVDFIIFLDMTHIHCADGYHSTCLRHWQDSRKSLNDMLTGLFKNNINKRIK